MKIRYRKECSRSCEDKMVYEVLHITNTFSINHNTNRFGSMIGNYPTETYFLVASKNNNSFFWIADYDCELVREEGWNMTLNELIKSLNKLLEENETLGNDNVYFYDYWNMSYESIDEVDYEFDGIQEDDRVVIIK